MSTASQKELATFLKIKPTGVIESFVRWVIDSKFRTTLSLTEYLNENLKRCINGDSKEYIEIRDKAHQLRMECKNWNEFVVHVLRYVHGRFKYTSDQSLFGMAEKWEDWDIAWKNKQGDCETQNSIIFGMCYIAGMNKYINTLFCVIGDTGLDEDDKPDHFYLMYYDVNSEGMYVIDSTAYYNGSEIENRAPYNSEITDKYGKIYYIFNEDDIFTLQL